MVKPAVIPEEGPQKPPATLGDVLYAKAKGAVPEQHWETLIEAVATGNQLALHELYEMAHRIVFTLIMRLTANRETAEELTIDVFHDVWRRAWRYDAANGTVLGWIMNQARSRAIDRLRFESRKKRSQGSDLPRGLRVRIAPGLNTVMLGRLRQDRQKLPIRVARQRPLECFVDRAGDHG